MTETADALDPGFAEYLFDGLTHTLPPCANEAAAQARQDAMRIAFRSMQPRTPMEAMLAIEAICAHHLIMDCYRQALAPESDPAIAARARSNVATLTRVRLATLRVLEARAAPAQDAAPPAPSPPPPEPVRRAPAAPVVPPYQPRDRFGNPIADWKWQELSMAQRRAAYGDANDMTLRATAIAEEEAAIAEQAALSAAAAAGADLPEPMAAA